jgi:hypothetical protein
VATWLELKDIVFSGSVLSLTESHMEGKSDHYGLACKGRREERGKLEKLSKCS